eukprot:7948971-Pyramimonas_sp.AAC.1
MCVTDPLQARGRASLGDARSRVELKAVPGQVDVCRQAVCRRRSLPGYPGSLHQGTLAVYTRVPWRSTLGYPGGLHQGTLAVYTRVPWHGLRAPSGVVREEQGDSFDTV